MRRAALSCLAVILALGCTTSTPLPSSPPPSCATVVIALCNAACTCGATDTTRVCSLATSVDGAGGGALSWPDANACQLYFSSACADGGGAGFNYSACGAAIPQFGCVSTVNGPGYYFPHACNVAIPEAGADSAK